MASVSLRSVVATVVLTATTAIVMPLGFGSTVTGGLGAQSRLATLGPPQPTPFARSLPSTATILPTENGSSIGRSDNRANSKSDHNVILNLLSFIAIAVIYVWMVIVALIVIAVLAALVLAGDVDEAARRRDPDEDDPDQTDRLAPPVRVLAFPRDASRAGHSSHRKRRLP